MEILIVDGDAISRKLLRAMLEIENYAVLEAADGTEALNIKKKKILIVDDDRNFIQAMNTQLRANGLLKAVRVTLGNGHGEDKDL